MDLPIIRRQSIKITNDGKLKTDSNEGTCSVPFESDDPEIINYLNKLVQ